MSGSAATLSPAGLAYTIRSLPHPLIYFIQISLSPPLLTYFFTIISLVDLKPNYRFVSLSFPLFNFPRIFKLSKDLFPLEGRLVSADLIRLQLPSSSAFKPPRFLLYSRTFWDPTSPPTTTIKKVLIADDVTAYYQPFQTGALIETAGAGLHHEWMPLPSGDGWSVLALKTEFDTIASMTTSGAASLPPATSGPMFPNPTLGMVTGAGADGEVLREPLPLSARLRTLLFTENPQGWAAHWRAIEREICANSNAASQLLDLQAELDIKSQTLMDREQQLEMGSLKLEQEKLEHRTIMQQQQLSLSQQLQQQQSQFKMQQQRQLELQQQLEQQQRLLEKQLEQQPPPQPPPQPQEPTPPAAPEKPADQQPTSASPNLDRPKNDSLTGKGHLQKGRDRSRQRRHSSREGGNEKTGDAARRRSRSASRDRRPAHRRAHSTETDPLASGKGGRNNNGFNNNNNNSGWNRNELKVMTQFQVRRELSDILHREMNPLLQSQMDRMISDFGRMLNDNGAKAELRLQEQRAQEEYRKKEQRVQDEARLQEQRTRDEQSALISQLVSAVQQTKQQQHLQLQPLQLPPSTVAAAAPMASVAASTLAPNPAATPLPQQQQQQQQQQSAQQPLLQQPLLMPPPTASATETQIQLQLQLWRQQQEATVAAANAATAAADRIAAAAGARHSSSSAAVTTQATGDRQSRINPGGLLATPPAQRRRMGDQTPDSYDLSEDEVMPTRSVYPRQNLLHHHHLQQQQHFHQRHNLPALPAMDEDYLRTDYPPAPLPQRTRFQLGRSRSNQQSHQQQQPPESGMGSFLNSFRRNRN